MSADPVEPTPAGTLGGNLGVPGPSPRSRAQAEPSCALAAVVLLDPDGRPCAWGCAVTEEAARARAEQELDAWLQARGRPQADRQHFRERVIVLKEHLMPRPSPKTPSPSSTSPSPRPHRPYKPRAHSLCDAGRLAGWSAWCVCGAPLGRHPRRDEARAAYRVHLVSAGRRATDKTLSPPKAPKRPETKHKLIKAHWPAGNWDGTCRCGGWAATGHATRDDLIEAYRQHWRQHWRRA
jgi:hypothetical protein